MTTKNARKMREKRILSSTFKRLQKIAKEYHIPLPENSDSFLQDISKMVIYDGYFESCKTKEEFAEDLRSLAEILKKDYAKAPAI